jgi:hypothetical protein
MKRKVEKRDAFLVLSVLLYRMLVQDSQNNNSNNKQGYS